MTAPIEKFPRGPLGLPISAWAIQNPSPVALLFIALVIAGAFFYTRLPIKNLPTSNSRPRGHRDHERCGSGEVEARSPGRSRTRSPASQHRQPVPPPSARASRPRSSSSRSARICRRSATTSIQDGSGPRPAAARDRRTAASTPRDQQRADHHPTRWRAPSMSVVDLSWFIDNDLGRMLQGVPGVAPRSAVSAASDRGSTSSSIRCVWPPRGGHRAAGQRRAQRCDRRRLRRSGDDRRPRADRPRARLGRQCRRHPRPGRPRQPSTFR